VRVVGVRWVTSVADLGDDPRLSAVDVHHGG
jgi:hypothetical protein